MRKRPAHDSLEYLLRKKGFQHGASGDPVDPAHADSHDYNLGYARGRRELQLYCSNLCFDLNLTDPVCYVP